jgi:hypothetical protein
VSRTAAALAAATLLLATACNEGDPAAAPSASATPSGTAVAVLDEAALKTALLVAADLPAGYVVGEPPTQDDPPGTGAQCYNLLAGIDAMKAKASAVAEAEYDRTTDDSDAGAAQLLASLPDVPSAIQVLEGFGKVVDRCKTFDETIGDVAFRGTVTRLQLGGLSPDALSFALEATLQGPGRPVEPLAADCSLARVGTTVSSMVVAEYGRKVDHQVTGRLAARAYAKLQAAGTPGGP